MMAESEAVDSEFEDLEIPADEDGKDSIMLSPEQTRWKQLAKDGLVVPYRTVHSTPQSFKTPNRKCFIPGSDIHVNIIEVERTASTHRLSPNLYVIQIQHGDYTWTVKRRYKHFQHLNQQLQLYRATLSIPFPTKLHRQRRSSYKSSKHEAGKTHGLPRFPKRPEALVATDQQEDRKRALEFYLQNLLKIRAFRNHHETLEFLEVSHLSFVCGLGPKGKEGLVLKRTGTNRSHRCTCGFSVCLPCFRRLCDRIQRCCGEICGQWQRRWLVAKDTFIAYIRPKDGRIHCVMLIDNEFEVSSALYDMGVPHGVIISNLSRQLVMKCWTKRKGKEWLDFLRKITTTEAARGFLDTNRFNSYAPIRSNVDAKWFVDGASYMSAIADTIEAANEEILISDWWLSPEIYMKRPVYEGEKWRLDKLLQRKAKEGVKIFVLLYKEVNLALGINSFYSKQKLVEQDNENIKVLRHPDHVSAGVLLWAHHEKLVIVDQAYAFVGGIDLCYGRWDDHNHRLADLGSLTSHQKATGGLQKKITSSQRGGIPNPSSILHLAKATNMVTIGTLDNFTRTFHPVVNTEPDKPVITTDEVDDAGVIAVTETEVEMSVMFAAQNGKLDVENKEVENGVSTLDLLETPSEIGDADPVTPLKGETPPTGRKGLQRKFTQVSRNIKEKVSRNIDRYIPRKESQEGSDSSSDSDAGKKATEDDRDSSFRPTIRKKRSANNSLRDKSLPKINHEMLGLQGSAKLWMGKDYTNFIVKDFVDLESPFTDMVDRSTTPRMPWHDIGMMVQGNAARDVARHFIQRWNAVKDEKARVNTSYPYLIPKSYDFKNENIHPIISDRSKIFNVSAQVVRSVCQWSAGVRGTVEDSIQQAYVDSIEKAKHYVYIENQFFITLAVANQQVQNRIGEALLQRILRAHKEGAVFRVFVVIPLLPGFEGEVGTARGVAIHAITHWNYSSICRGPDALLTKLRCAGIEDTSQYITFHGLRTFSELHGDLVTELIYVHSKLMIVDDNLVICGSANINDRSMIGKRDSEVAVVLMDEVFQQSVMNGSDYKAGKFAQSLRIQLFREHLGLLSRPEVDVKDPVCDEFYNNEWIRTAELNTSLLDQVFNCIPSDKCTTFTEFAEYQKRHQLSSTDPDHARTLLQNVRGHLVMLPLQFLCGENLLPSHGTREALMPTSLWT